MFYTTQFFLISYLLYIVMGRHLDFRERFLERKRLRSLEDHRITTLNNYDLTHKQILDDIAHYRKIKGSSSRVWKKIRAIEKDFRRLLAMNGVKYNYKRDMFWRTWRSIPPVNGDTKQFVSYKCNNLIHGNATECQSCGMWTIEDQTPPCPFEFFSLLSDEELCGVNYTQYKDVTNNCPSVIKFSDMAATCDNPIETHWRFTKKYGITEKFNEVICKGKYFCEIFTIYEITQDHVVFRIINSTYDVIYSRIMKAKNKNYICVENCGRLNPNTRKVAKSDKPLKLDLLPVRKTKREDFPNDINYSITNMDVLNEKKNEHLAKKLPIKVDVSNEMDDNVPKKENVWNQKNDNVTKKKDVSNENDPKRKKFFNEINEGLLSPKEVTKEDVLNEINESDPKREKIVKEMNEGLKLPTEVTQTEEVLNGMNVSGPKREKYLNELNEGLNLPTEVTQTEEVLNEMNLSDPKREKNLNEMNEGLNLPKELTQTKEVLNEMKVSGPKREKYLSELNEGLNLPTEVTQTEEVLNEMNLSDPKREKNLNEMNEGLNLPKELTQTKEVLNEMKVSDPKRKKRLNELNEGLNLPTEPRQTKEVLNEINISDPKSEKHLNELNVGLKLPMEPRQTKEVLNEINISDPKSEKHLNELNEGLDLPTEVTQTEHGRIIQYVHETEEVLNEVNVSGPKREKNLNEMNEGLSVPTDVKTEVLNDVLSPIEDDKSLSNISGDDYVLISIEQTRPLRNLNKDKKKTRFHKNSRHKIKSRSVWLPFFRKEAK